MGSSNGGRGGEEQLNRLADLSKTLKEGERILAPTRRPDGTFRKAIRIRAGYNPPDEVAIYQSKGALLKKEMAALQEVPPGYDRALDVKPKTKSAKRNERKKEKRLQDKQLEPTLGAEIKEEASNIETLSHVPEFVESVTSRMKELAVSGNSSVEAPPGDATEAINPVASTADVDKRIRALKKKIRLAEVQKQKTLPQDMKPEQRDKMDKLESWRQELKLLEYRKEQIDLTS